MRWCTIVALTKSSTTYYYYFSGKKIKYIMVKSIRCFVGLTAGNRRCDGVAKAKRAYAKFSQSTAAIIRASKCIVCCAIWATHHNSAHCTPNWHSHKYARCSSMRIWRTT